MTKKTPLLATPKNMREFGARGVFAYDRYAHERYSADAGDYFMTPDDEPLRGRFGKPLILAREICYIEAV